MVPLLIDGPFRKECKEKARLLTFVGPRRGAGSSGGATMSWRARASGENLGASSRFSGHTVTNPWARRPAILGSFGCGTAVRNPVTSTGNVAVGRKGTLSGMSRTSPWRWRILETVLRGQHLSKFSTRIEKDLT